MASIRGTGLDDLLDATLLGFGNENNTISGGAGNDILIGGDGDDTLNGGSGQDEMRGGKGNDRYTVDADDDPSKIIENENEGFDSVSSSVSWTLGNHFERLVLIGANPLNGTGNDLDNQLIGNIAANILMGLGGNDSLGGGGGDDELYGGDGNDSLNGGDGVDVLVGGDGDDKYFVDNLLDTIIEQEGQGTDLVFARGVDGYTLPNHVEHLFLSAGVLSGNGNDGDNYIQGNEDANVINGNGGDDFLHGRGGDDELNGGGGSDRLDGGSGTNTLRGGLGNDNYFVRSSTDIIDEASGEGTDTLYLLAQSYTLAASASIETIILVQIDPLNPTAPPTAMNVIANGFSNNIIGNSLNNNIIGNNLANILDGNNGNDVLRGEDGDDVLNGGIGNDDLIGGLGNDVLNGGGGGDDLFGDTAPNQIDLMTSGAGQDDYHLGTLADGIFYNDGNPNSNGLTDYADILDFNKSVDEIIVNTLGNTVNYTYTLQGADTVISFNYAVNSEPVSEIIAIVRNATPADVFSRIVEI